MARIKGINPKRPEILKIKIGEHSDRKTGSGTWLPTRLDFFRITTTEKDKEKKNFLPATDVIEALGQGPEPREIPILLPFDDVDMNFQTSYARYKGRSCMCRGDGKEAEMVMQKDGVPKQFILLDTDKLGESVHKDEKRKIVCDPETCPFTQPDAKGITACKPNGRLICIIPASKRLNGYAFFRTTSYNTIGYILQALDDMKEQTGGILKGIPMKLFFFKKNTESHGNVPVVSIDFDFDEIQDMREAAIKELTYRKQFDIDIKAIEDKARQSGVLDDHDDPADIVSEFYPEQTEEYKQHQQKIKTSATSRADSVLDQVGKAEDAVIVEDVQPNEPVEAEKPKKSETVKSEESEPKVQPEQAEDAGNLDLF